MIQEQLHALLAPLADGGCHPLTAPMGTPAPYITYQRIVAVSQNYLSGTSDLQNTRMQLDAYAKTYAAAQALAGQIITAMKSAGFRNLKLSEKDLPDPDTKLIRVSLDYSIWQ